MSVLYPYDCQSHVLFVNGERTRKFHRISPHFTVFYIPDNFTKILQNFFFFYFLNFLTCISYNDKNK